MGIKLKFFLSKHVSVFKGIDLVYVKIHWTTLSGKVTLGYTILGYAILAVLI